jgi:hypothetical protein
VQLSDMQSRVSQRLAEGATGPVYYPSAEITAALNEALRYFCLLTLCLEKTASWTPAAGFTRMLTVFSDWICPLRITTAAGLHVRQSTIAELSALCPGWNVSGAGAISRYLSLGSDMIAVYMQTFAPLKVTYARSPVALALSTDVPEIPNEYHPALVSYAIYRCRQGEGGQEFLKALPYHDSFMEAAKVYAQHVRTRNRGPNYDKLPPEDNFFDRARLVPRMPATLIPTDDGTVLPKEAA